MPKLPDRWLDYSNIGNLIEGTKIITFKVPLKESFFSKINDKTKDVRFTPTTLIESIKEKGLNLGLVIDLTFTKKYYNEEEFTEKNIKYKKIFVEGHVIPSQDVMNEFYEAVDKFLETSEEDSLIGVHCTHGVNRTGYVVCRYMVEHLHMKASDSLNAYEKGRGYPVERINYINDLKRRAGEPVPKEDEEREEREEEEKSRKKSARGNLHKNDNSESRDNSQSDRRRENISYQNRQTSFENLHYSNNAGQDRNYEGHSNVMFNGNSHEDQYCRWSGNYGSDNRQYINQDVINEYQLDPNTWYGYNTPARPSPQYQHNQGYSNGACYGNSGGPSPFLQNLNQFWGSGACQGVSYNQQSYIQNNEYSDYNWRNDSCKSYSRHNSDFTQSNNRQNSNSRHGRGNKGRNRMKPF